MLSDPGSGIMPFAVSSTSLYLPRSVLTFSLISALLFSTSDSFAYPGIVADSAWNAFSLRCWRSARTFAGSLLSTILL